MEHVVSKDGVSTDQERKDEENFRLSSPVLQAIHEILSVLELFSCYRRFVPHFGEIAKPPIKLTEKDKTFQGKEELNTSFQHHYQRQSVTVL